MPAPIPAAAPEPSGAMVPVELEAADRVAHEINGLYVEAVRWSEVDFDPGCQAAERACNAAGALCQLAQRHLDRRWVLSSCELAVEHCARARRGCYPSERYHLPCGTWRGR